jgi:hypothetical protein
MGVTHMTVVRNRRFLTWVGIVAVVAAVGAAVVYFGVLPARRAAMVRPAQGLVVAPSVASWKPPAWLEGETDRLSIRVWPGHDVDLGTLINRGESGFSQALAPLVAGTGSAAGGPTAAPLPAGLTDKVSVWVYDSLASLRAATGQFYPDWRVSEVTLDGVIILSSQAIARNNQDFHRIFVHELNHYLLSRYVTAGGRRLTDLPTWLAEGVAGLASGQLSGGLRNTFLWSLPAPPAALPSLAEVALGFGPRQMPLRHEYAFSAVECLARTHGAGAPRRLVDLICAGATPEEAITKITGRPVKDFEVAWHAWLRAWMPIPAAGTGPSPAQVQPSSGGAGIPVPPGAAWRITERRYPGAPGPVVFDGVIPFLVAEPRPAGERQDVLIGWWDLKTGTVTFSPTPVCTVKVDTLRLIWDGGPRVGLMMEPPLPPVNPSPLMTLDLLRGGANGIVSCPSGETSIYLLTPRFLDALSGMEGDPTNRRYPLTSCNRAVILTVSDGRAEALLVATVVGEPGSPGGLGLARYVLEEGVLRAKTSSPPLNITEAAGYLSQWTRVGDRIYTTGSTTLLRYWDMATGEVGDGPDLEPRLRAYETDRALEMEYPVPPSLFGYLDLLIVEYRPAAVESRYDRGGRLIARDPIQTAHFVVLRGGEVLGEVTLHKGRLTVRKGGQVTQEADLGPAYGRFWWFPGMQTPP